MHRLGLDHWCFYKLFSGCGPSCHLCGPSPLCVDCCVSAGFKDAKSLLCSAPVLDAPNVLLPFRSEVDGSTSGAGVAADL